MKTFRYIPLLMATGMLIGMIRADRLQIDPSSAEPYHRSVLAAFKSIPMHIGPWAGHDIPIAPAAVALLKPNAMLTRVFENERSHQKVILLAIQSRDARDMRGHCPSICYPANGWTQNAAPAIEWQDQSLAVHGREYQFVREGASGKQLLFVRSFFVLPEGQTVRDMDELIAAAKDYRKLPFGAAQFQVVFSGESDPAQRQAIFDEFITANASLIRVVQGGDSQ